MERLTTKTLESYRDTYDRYEGIESSEFERICDELIGYKSLEKELGIDLITLFKALKEGVWYKFENANIRYIYGHYLDLGFYVDHFVFWLNETSSFNLKDYGKTWWLEKPKEELENE